MNSLPDSSVSRREWLAAASLAGLATLTGCSTEPPLQTAATKPATVDAPFDQLLQFPGKVPLRAVNDRPPCLETPWEFFKTDITPNNAFYVRWHLQNLPIIDDKYRLKLAGHVQKPIQFSLEELRKLPATSVVAVNQCSGNSRGLFEPHIPGAQWNNGAMGNARWTGVKLADLLKLADVKPGATEVTFAGLDNAGAITVPDYVKSLPFDVANGANALLAYEMNGVPLPPLNGFPLRLVVPGWFATYWVKALGEITVLNKRYDGYWMAKAYRIPQTGQADKPGNLAKETVPINKLLVRSFFVTPAMNAELKAGQPVQLEGIAFDGGSGIKAVEVSEDQGNTWKGTQLGEDLGPYSFRRWKISWTPATPGSYQLKVRATSHSGETQSATPTWSRSGYLRNVIESWTLKAV